MTEDTKSDIVTSVFLHMYTVQREYYQPQKVSVLIVTDKCTLATLESEKV
jgi:hypothetical protein